VVVAAVMAVRTMAVTAVARARAAAMDAAQEKKTRRIYCQCFLKDNDSYTCRNCNLHVC
jgi:hypothetical protein